MNFRVRWTHVTVLITVLIVATGWRIAEGGGVPPESVPPEWVAVTPASGADLLEFLQRLPQEANPLGVRAAHLRTVTPSASFYDTRFSSTDGTPLAGILGAHRGGQARPGVVLVPGWTQTTHQKYMVALADLLFRNGWHVLAIDPRGQGISRTLSPALISGGWKEANDTLGAVRHLRERTRATSVAVIGFSDGGRSLVKAMAAQGGDSIAAGIAVTAPLAARPPVLPPPPGATPTPFDRFFLDLLGATSFYEYDERAARSYGVDLPTMAANAIADTDVTQVKAPLLFLYALDDILWLGHIKQGRHEGGSMSLAYRDRVQDRPNVRTLLVDRGNHAGMLYLSDPHWFGLVVLNTLKHWQARDVPAVTTTVPPLDILTEGSLREGTATYRFVVRNHGSAAVGPLDIVVDLAAGAHLEHCWLGAEGLGRCANAGQRLTWTLPRLSGGKTTAGPFGAVIDVSSLKPGPFEAVVSIDQFGTLPQEIRLEKK